MNHTISMVSVEVSDENKESDLNDNKYIFAPILKYKNYYAVFSYHCYIRIQTVHDRISLCSLCSYYPNNKNFNFKHFDSKYILARRKTYLK